MNQLGTLGGPQALVQLTTEERWVVADNAMANPERDANTYIYNCMLLLLSFPADDYSRQCSVLCRLCVLPERAQSAVIGPEVRAGGTQEDSLRDRTWEDPRSFLDL